MDRIDLYRTFCAVVDVASFTRAADTLGVPRSSVSAAVQQLETLVGARLLHRTTRKVAPTQDGIAFYERCTRLISDAQELEALFRHSASRPYGALRINVPGRIGRLIIAPNLPHFLAQYPEIEIELGITDRAVDLIEDSVDCVLRVGSLTDSSLVARPIGDLQLINVASPHYLAKHGVPATPTDLDGHQAIGYASPSTGRLAEWEWLEDGATMTRPVQSKVKVNSAEGYIACCLAGLGLIQIPAYDVRGHIEAGELAEVMPHHRAAPMPMTLLYPHRRHLSRRLQVFADWLVPLLRSETVEN